MRTGQTEGAVDLCRLAGLEPAGVICEILNQTVPWRVCPRSCPFAREHGLKIGTVANIIQYRLQTESLVSRVATSRLPSRYGGEFTAHVYRSSVEDGEHIVLVKGDIHPDESGPGSRACGVPTRATCSGTRSAIPDSCFTQPWSESRRKGAAWFSTFDVMAAAQKCCPGRPGACQHESERASGDFQRLRRRRTNSARHRRSQDSTADQLSSAPAEHLGLRARGRRGRSALSYGVADRGFKS